jgi:hypothetical protein
MTTGGILQWRERHRGYYNASDGVLTLIYTSSEQCTEPKQSIKTDYYNDIEQDWEPHDLAESRNFTYGMGIEYDKTRLYIEGLLPSADYVFTKSGLYKGGYITFTMEDLEERHMQ